MSIFFLTMAILGAVLVLVVTYCLMAMAQRADDHLEQLGLGEAEGRWEDRQTEMAKIPLQEGREAHGALPLKP